MVRMVRVNDAVLSDINTVSDLSYAWELIRDFVDEMHERIRNDAKSVQVRARAGGGRGDTQ